MTKPVNLLAILLDKTGFDPEDPSQVLDSIVPGICRDPDCHTVHDSVEPDATNNWCDECSQPTVVAVTVLMGVI